MVLVGTVLALLLSACSQLAAEAEKPEETTKPELAGLEVAAPAPNELIFQARHPQRSPAQPVTVRNVGDAPLELTRADIVGVDAADFGLTGPASLPLEVAPGEAFTFELTFAPTNAAGTSEAELRVASNDPDKRVVGVGLYGLAISGEGGRDEPTLQAVVDTLGFAVDVGSEELVLGTSSEPIGDEVSAPLFQKAGSGPVTLVPVARFGPEEVLPYGYFTLKGGEPVLREVARVGAAHAQTLRPPLETGRTRFDPGGGPFGLFAEAGGSRQHTLGSLNTGPSTHAARIYPLKDRRGRSVPNSYLVTLEEAANGDYQDAVFVLSNVKAVGRAPSTAPSGSEEGWTRLFNGENLDGWYTYLPSRGRDNDPEGVFKVENGVLHILGVEDTGGYREYGYLATEEEFEDYHLRLEYRWGEERFIPRANSKRDSGVIYHFTGADTIWPRGVEYQIQESDTGDFWLVDGVTLSSTIRSRQALIPRYEAGGEPYTSPPGDFVRLMKSETHDRLTGWNTVEIIVQGDSATHIVNGEVVNRAHSLRQPSAGGVRALSRGRILLQAEGAEVFYRNIEIRPLN